MWLWCLMAMFIGEHNYKVDGKLVYEYHILIIIHRWDDNNRYIYKFFFTSMIEKTVSPTLQIFITWIYPNPGGSTDPNTPKLLQSLD